MSSPQRRKQQTKQTNHHEPSFSSTNRHHWWYLGLLAGVCYIQIAINFVVYQYSSREDDVSERHSGLRFPFRTWQQQNYQEDKSQLLLDTLSNLQQRADRMLQQQAHVSSQQYRDDGRFLPFTIRDARRTVPTQIAYGFHVLDFIDVDKQDTYSFVKEDDDEFDHVDDAEKVTNAQFLDPPLSPSPLFHNGFPVAYPFNVSLARNATLECQEYSLGCYRSNLLQAMRYLLEAPQFHNYTHFFYMESDYDLCVSLSRIRSLAYRYPRNLLSVGTGSSGWLMSRDFLQDFYGFYRKHEQDSPLLSPDASASALLLQQDQRWSVTRRYLISHTILSSTVNGVVDTSLTDHFEFDIDPASAANNATNTTSELMDTANSTLIHPLNATVAEQTKPKEAKLLPLLVPKCHLPRCLEPRRGHAREEQEDHDDDVTQEEADKISSWDYFDYYKCPDSQIFPCDGVDLTNHRKKRTLRGASHIRRF